jgi:hypothetical protein
MTTNSTSREVANEILNQLGGSRFIAMTGAYNFVTDGKDLTMKLRTNQAKATHLKIELDDMDTYPMTFYACRKEIKVVKEVKGVYNDMLQKIFTNVTGYETRL